MSSWTIAKRLFAAFTILLALAVALGAFSLLVISAAKTRDTQIVSGQYPETIALYEIQESITQNFGRMGAALIAPADERRKLGADVATALQDTERTVQDYEAKITDGEEQAAITDLKADFGEFQKTTSDIVKANAADHSSDAISSFSTKLVPIFNKLVDNDLANLLATQRGKIDRTINDINWVTSNGSTGVIVATGLDAAILVLVGWLLMFSITRPLSLVARGMKEGSILVSTLANTVSTGSQSLAEGASEQAASLEETASSMEQLASMTRSNSENANLANEIAKQTRAAADKGAVDMESMSSAMEAIKASSDDIAKIIKTIDEIAFQTNILALNAAVEAARAGEAGMGFAVVADEVRSLAQRSAQAAKETAIKIEGAISRSGQGVEISAKVANALGEIVLKARRMDELVAEVASASHEQTEGIAQINLAIGQMDKVTQGNSANAESSAAAAAELKAQSERMKESITEIVKIIGWDGEDSAASSRLPMPGDADPFNPRSLTEDPNSGAPPNGIDRVPKQKTVASRRSEIPLEGEFKDF